MVGFLCCLLYLWNKNDGVYESNHGVFLTLLLIEVFCTIYLWSLDQLTALQRTHDVVQLHNIFCYFKHIFLMSI